MHITKLLFVLSIVLVVLSVAISAGAQTVRPDRISFYNEPADSNKFESHINYASGGPEVHKSYGVCEAGRVISETLNLYTASWTVEACAASTHQHLNLRWVENCLWDMEHDPWVRIDTYGSYGRTTMVGHYDQGEVDLPIPTDTLSMTVVMSHTEGTELWTGNALFVFSQPIGCTSSPNTQTPTPTDTSTSVSTLTPTQMPTDTPASTPEPSATDIESYPATSTPTASPEPSVTATETPTPTPTVGEVGSSTTPTGEPPTGLTPTGEPGLSKVYLPRVDR